MSDQFCDLPKGRQLCFRTYGAGRPMLLIAGLGLQLTFWPILMIDSLVAQGFRVIVFDNRDTGRSSRSDVPPPSMFQLLTRSGLHDAYDLDDMARDTLALLDHLEIVRADVVGMSMGGMIAQQLAVLAPERVATLTSIFSTTGARRVGQPSLRVMLRMMKKPAVGRIDWMEDYVAMLRLIAGWGYPFDAARSRRDAAIAWARGGEMPQEGTARQVAAIMKSGNRTAQLARLDVPCLVIHGDRDPMVATSGGRATAEAIAGARLMIIRGMGHDLAAGVIPQIVDGIAQLSAEAAHG